MVWLGIDLGDARVGLALSDPELTFAHPIGNVQVFGDSFRAIDDVMDLIEKEKVRRVVIGLPLQLDGSEGKSAKKARRWGKNLAKRIESAKNEGDWLLSYVPDIVWKDERLTTVSAHRQLLQADFSSKQHRPMVDQQSAVLILQSALDANHCEADCCSANCA
ncbi:Holliday junction resolvase RuvX [Gardnerella sp. KA00747]|uniref:Holliday junction resolvase RuvX n=1 Tax=Gardnerella sp. KA00747 TaxID=2749078 RepID=UPI003BAC5C55